MNARQFYEEVKKMRYLQKKYFLTRDHRALEASKKFEKRIDAEIERLRYELSAVKEEFKAVTGFDFRDSL